MKSHEITIPPVDESKAQELFNGASLKLTVDSIEKQLNELSLDPTNPSDYKKFGSIKLQLGSFFAAVDRAGKSIVDPINAIIKETNSQRKVIKDRGIDIKASFMLVREQYDEEVAAYNKAINDLEDLLRHGHLKLAEFGKPTSDTWKEFLDHISSSEISESLQGDRCKEFKALKAESFDLNGRRYVAFVENEKALAAGRIALKEKEDAEAAARHEARQEAKAPAAAPKPDGKAPAITEPTTAEIMGGIKNKLFGQLVKYGMPRPQAKMFVEAVHADEIDNLKLYV